ncbi:MAG: hypothetical protein ABSE85_14515 [Candidatus Korobacteraceae bacterium]
MPVLPQNSSGMARAAEQPPCGDICSIGNIQEHLMGKGRLEAVNVGWESIGQFPWARE